MIMRGLDSKNTSVDMLEYWRLYYNFIRNHQGLDGKTPSELVNIELNLNNKKWENLLMQSM